jgi:hypothetical protein
MTLHRANEVAERRLREDYPPDTSPLPPRLRSMVERLKLVDT